MPEVLCKSGDVQGMQVTGLGHAKLGAVRELFVDLLTGQIQFVIVETAGLLGGSGKFHPVPWPFVQYDPLGPGLQVKISKDDFKTSPSYDREQLANANTGWGEQSTRFFTSSESSAAAV
jgi:hypothetical protein